MSAVLAFVVDRRQRSLIPGGWRRTLRRVRWLAETELSRDAGAADVLASDSHAVRILAAACEKDLAEVLHRCVGQPGADRDTGLGRLFAGRAVFLAQLLRA